MTRGINRKETTSQPQRYQALHLSENISVKVATIANTVTIPTENDAAITVIHTHASGCTLATTSTNIPTAAETSAASINKVTPPTRNRIV